MVSLSWDGRGAGGSPHEARGCRVVPQKGIKNGVVKIDNTEGPGRVPEPMALPCDVSSEDFAVAEAYRSVRARKQRVSHADMPEAAKGSICPCTRCRGVQVPGLQAGRA